MKNSLLWSLCGLTLVLTACGTQTTVENPEEILAETSEIEALAPSLFPALVGAADNADAQLVSQDGAWYYDFGSIEADAPSYPLAFRVDLPQEEIASVEATIAANDGFVIDTTSGYQQGELFTVSLDPTAEAGNRSAVVIVSGTTVSGLSFEAIFVAVAEVL
jgi:hypothetical protein